MKIFGWLLFLILALAFQLTWRGGWGVVLNIALGFVFLAAVTQNLRYLAAGLPLGLLTDLLGSSFFGAATVSLLSSFLFVNWLANSFLKKSHWLSVLILAATGAAFYYLSWLTLIWVGMVLPLFSYRPDWHYLFSVLSSAWLANTMLCWLIFYLFAKKLSGKAIGTVE